MPISMRCAGGSRNHNVSRSLTGLIHASAKHCGKASPLGTTIVHLFTFNRIPQLTSRIAGGRNWWQWRPMPARRAAELALRGAAAGWATRAARSPRGTLAEWCACGACRPRAGTLVSRRRLAGPRPPAAASAFRFTTGHFLVWPRQHLFLNPDPQVRDISECMIDDPPATSHQPGPA